MFGSRKLSENIEDRPVGRLLKRFAVVAMFALPAAPLATVALSRPAAAQPAPPKFSPEQEQLLHDIVGQVNGIMGPFMAEMGANIATGKDLAAQGKEVGANNLLANCIQGLYPNLNDFINSAGIPVSIVPPLDLPPPRTATNAETATAWLNNASAKVLRVLESKGIILGRIPTEDIDQLRRTVRIMENGSKAYHDSLPLVTAPGYPPPAASTSKPPVPVLPPRNPTPFQPARPAIRT